MHTYIHTYIHTVHYEMFVVPSLLVVDIVL